MMPAAAAAICGARAPCTATPSTSLSSGMSMMPGRRLSCASVIAGDATLASALVSAIGALGDATLASALVSAVSGACASSGVWLGSPSGLGMGVLHDGHRFHFCLTGALHAGFVHSAVNSSVRTGSALSTPAAGCAAGNGAAAGGAPPARKGEREKGREGGRKGEVAEGRSVSGRAF